MELMKATPVDLGEQRLRERLGLLVRALLPMLPAGSWASWRRVPVTKALAAWALDDWLWEQALVCCPR